MNMKNILFSILAVLILVSSATKSGYEIGDKVDDFKLKNVDGEVISLADFKDAKGFIVIFDCNSCPYSRAYNSRILALDKKFSSKGFPVIAINSNVASGSEGESMEAMAKYSKSHKYTFPYLADDTQKVAKAFGATNTPHVFVLQKTEGNLVVAYIGTIDDSPKNESKVKVKYVENAVDALLSGKPVETSKTKAIGCGIKFLN